MNLLIILGLALGVGYFFGKLTHHLKITAVVGYLLIGIIFGPYGLGIIVPSENIIQLVTVVSLGLIAFEIGITLSPERINKIGKKIVGITFLECLITYLVTFIGTYFFLQNIFTSLILASLATATAPASRMALIREYRAKGALTDRVIAVVGIDDAFGVVFFTVTITIIKTFLEEVSFFVIGLNSFIEVFGPIVLGAVVAASISYLIKRFEGEEELFVTILFSVLLTSGIAEYLEFDWILASLSLGFVFVILMRDKAERAKDFLTNRVMAPVFVVFFVIVGVTMKIDLLFSAGVLAVVYVLFRSIGKIVGGTISAKAFKSPKVVQKYLGISLLSQAGVAVGLALTVSKELPNVMVGETELGSLIITVIAASSILFEFVGTISFRYVLEKTGEANR